MSPQTVDQFAEKVALISDASDPVGRAAAMQLALQGSYVVGLFPGAENERDVSVRELVELGTLAFGFAIDPCSDSGAAEAAAEITSRFGRLDLLVNCLKSKAESSFEAKDKSVFLDVVRKDLDSVHVLTQAVRGLMETRPRPAIVNIAVGGTGFGSKALAPPEADAVDISRSMLRSLPRNFRVNGVEVGGGSEIWGSVSSCPPPDDIARVVLFLLSSESRAINGQVLRVGGFG